MSSYVEGRSNSIKIVFNTDHYIAAKGWAVDWTGERMQYLLQMLCSFFLCKQHMLTSNFSDFIFSAIYSCMLQLLQHSLVQQEASNVYLTSTEITTTETILRALKVNDVEGKVQLLYPLLDI